MRALDNRRTLLRFNRRTPCSIWSISHPENRGGVTIEIVEVTPGIAAAWLDKNIKNRRKSTRHISQSVRDTKTGNWQLTGDSIKFDKNGTLVDGQHRLTACVESDTSFRTLVIYGLEPSTRNVIDTGKSRSNSDVLTMQGATNTIGVAACLKFLVNEKNENTGSGGRLLITHSELLNAYEQHPAIGLYVPQPGTMPRGIPNFLIGYVNYVASNFIHNKKQRAGAMMDVLKTGNPDYENCPMHGFREKIIRQITGARVIGNREMMINTFKHVWNAFAKKEPLQSIKFIKSSVDIDGLALSKL